MRGRTGVEVGIGRWAGWWGRRRGRRWGRWAGGWGSCFAVSFSIRDTQLLDFRFRVLDLVFYSISPFRELFDSLLVLLDLRVFRLATFHSDFTLLGGQIGFSRLKFLVGVHEADQGLAVRIYSNLVDTFLVGSVKLFVEQVWDSSDGEVCGNLANL